MTVLLAGCLLLPIGLFVGVSWFNYRAAFHDAYLALERSADVAREHAGKVFDGQSQVADRVDDLLRGMGLDDVKRSERRLHDAFAEIVIRLPQMQGVLVASSFAEPLVSATVFPIPGGISVADRDYYQAVVQHGASLFLTAVQVGDVNQIPFFGLAQPWIGSNGRVRGVIDVAVTPDLFEDFYRVLAGQLAADGEGGIVTLLRDDGQVLVRYPMAEATAARTLPSAAFTHAIAINPEGGTYEAVSSVDQAATRLFAYRKVQGYPAYVVAGRSRASVTADWRATMRSHLVLGVPATLALVAITWTALVRTRREEAALDRARHEILRRQKAEEALLRAQRLEAVGQMTGGVAHDFNNLLTIILGSAEALTRRPDDPARVQRIAGQIGLAARRGGEITQQLLAFSRRQFVNPQTVDLNACLLEFRPLLERAANESIRVVFDLQPGLHPALLDPGHFEAAILNLVGNARDAMPDGGTVIISTRDTAVDADADLVTEPSDRPVAGYVHVGVTDTGIGMDAQTAAKAFEPFFTTKEVGRGTGLGLSQVYGFAKQAGGDVRIATTHGRGTTVYLLLPWTQQDVEPSTQPRPPPSVRKADPGEVVLVVEDEPTVLATAVESLHDLGYATITANTAQAALTRLGETCRVDVLFSDITMPGGMDGLQLLSAARRLRPGLKALLTSGYTAGQSRPVNVPLLTKPYDRDQLAAQLRAVLQTPVA